MGANEGQEVMVEDTREILMQDEEQPLISLQAL